MTIGGRRFHSFPPREKEPWVFSLFPIVTPSNFPHGVSLGADLVLFPAIRIEDRSFLSSVILHARPLKKPAVFPVPP